MNILLVNLLASFDDTNTGTEGTEGTPAATAAVAGSGDGAAAATIAQQTGNVGAVNSSDASDDERLFNQVDLNKIVGERLAKDRKKRDEEFQDQVKSLELKYEELLTNKNLGDEEKEGLQKQLQNLRMQHRTQEQLLADEKVRLQDEWADKYQTANAKALEWEDRYTTSTITQALQAAAIEHGAWKPNQVIVQLERQTKLVEKLDNNGKPTGELHPMVEMTVKEGETGISEQLQMTPDEAVSYMKKNPDDWGNFFKNNIREGIGSTSATGGAITGDGTIDQTKLDDEQYFKLRAENKAALGVDYTN